MKQHRRDAAHLVADYSQLITDLPPVDTVFVGFNPGGGGGGGGGRRAVVATAAVSEPVSAPGQAQLEAVRGVLQSQLSFLDGQVGAHTFARAGRCELVSRHGQHADVWAARHVRPARGRYRRWAS